MRNRFARHLYELRLFECMVLAILSMLIVAYVTPQNLTVTIYKLSLVCLFALIGFRLDRMIFPYARPDRVPHDQAALAGLRRAVVIAAVIIGGTIGV